MTKLEDKFTRTFQEVLQAFKGESVNMELARQLYNGGYVNGKTDGEIIERQRILGIFRQRNRYGGLSSRVYEGLKRCIEGK